MKSQRTTSPPPVIEDLGDGTFYYNFEVAQSESADKTSGAVTVIYSYEQVRCSYPVVLEEVQQAVDAEGYSHTVVI